MYIRMSIRTDFVLLQHKYKNFKLDCVCAADPYVHTVVRTERNIHTHRQTHMPYVHTDVRVECVYIPY